MGEDWGRLVADYLAKKTFRARVFSDTSGVGTTEVAESGIVHVTFAR